MRGLKSIVFILAALIFFFAAGLLLINTDSPSIPWSSANARDDGCLAAFLLFEELGIDVGRFQGELHLPMEDEDASFDAMLLPYPPGRQMGLEKRRAILDWVFQGGNLVVLGDSLHFFSDLQDMVTRENTNIIGNRVPADTGQEREAYQDILQGDGIIRIVYDETLLLNSSLQEVGAGVRLLSVLWDFMDGKQVVFYEVSKEGYSFSPDSPAGIISAFTLLPMAARFLMLQLFIGLFLLIVLTGRRIGPPVYSRDIEVRADNEDIHAAAALMNRFALDQAAFVLNLGDFTEYLLRYFRVSTVQEVYTIWNERGYSHSSVLKELLDYSNQDESTFGLSRDEMIRQVKAMDMLRDALKRYNRYYEEEMRWD